MQVIVAFAIGIIDLRGRFSQGIQNPGVLIDPSVLITAVKTLVIFWVFIIGLIFTFFAFVLDLIIIISGETWNIAPAIWKFTWNKLILDWYWYPANGWGILLGAFLILILFSTFRKK
ncbi:MAG: hypothetical protein AAGD09_09700 [Cyanobacteria bacterium P01_F01_bin.56]